MEQENFIKKFILKFLYILLVPFTAQKFSPSTKQIFQGNGILKATNKFLPVIEHSVEVYKLWYQFRYYFPKKARPGIAVKIDNLLIEISELLLIASYERNQNKLPTLEAAIRKIDTLKFFLRISWEIKAIDNKKYLVISEHVQELGRMVGGWKKGLLTKTLLT